MPVQIEVDRQRSEKRLTGGSAVNIQTASGTKANREFSPVPRGTTAENPIAAA